MTAKFVRLLRSQVDDSAVSSHPVASGGSVPDVACDRDVRSRQTILQTNEAFRRPSLHAPSDFTIRMKHEVMNVLFICLNRAEINVQVLCLQVLCLQVLCL